MNQELVPHHPILLVDDEKHFLTSMSFALNTNGFTHVECCSDSPKVMNLLKKKMYSMIFLDLQMPKKTGDDLLPQIVANFPGVPVIILTAYSEIERVVNCIKMGAFDYVTKPIESAPLIEKVKQTLDFVDNKKKAEHIRHCYLSEDPQNPDAFKDIITKNKEMKRLFRYIEGISDSSMPVLITGESGVGKDKFAEVIHLLSGRNEDFYKINTGGISEEELSDLIFGAKKKKADGSIELTPGLAEKARKGTLFLDEFENLSDRFQTRLLRLVQNGEYYRFTADELLKTDARIIAATNQDIPTAIKNGKIRNDLYQRLNMHHIKIPPLRERKEDIPLLVEYYVQYASEKLKVEKPYIPRDLYILLQNYHFPGNVGELARMTGEAVKLNQNGVLNIDVFKEKMSEQEKIAVTETNSKNPDSTGPGKVPLEFGHPIPSYEELKTLYLDELMSRAENNKEKAARLAGLTLKNLNHRLKRVDKRKKKENGNKS